jgi:hypothetical protein
MDWVLTHLEAVTHRVLPFADEVDGCSRLPGLV